MTGVNTAEVDDHVVKQSRARRQKISIRSRMNGDEAGLALLYNRLSAETRYLRFTKGCSPRIDERSIRRWLASYHRPPRTCSLVAESDGNLIAESTYVRGDPHTVEAAIVVQDDFQRMGIGYKISSLLAWIAWQDGVLSFEGDILPSNRPVFRLLRRTGCPVAFRWKSSVVHFALDLRYVTANCARPGTGFPESTIQKG